MSSEHDREYAIEVTNDTLLTARSYAFALQSDAEIDAAQDLAIDIAANVGWGPDDDQALVTILEILSARFPIVAHEVLRSIVAAPKDQEGM